MEDKNDYDFKSKSNEKKILKNNRQHKEDHKTSESEEEDTPRKV